MTTLATADSCQGFVLSRRIYVLASVEEAACRFAGICAAEISHDRSEIHVTLVRRAGENGVDIAAEFLNYALAASAQAFLADEGEDS